MVAAIPYMVDPCMTLAGCGEVPKSEDIAIPALCLPSLEEAVPVHGRAMVYDGSLGCRSSREGSFPYCSLCSRKCCLLLFCATEAENLLDTTVLKPPGLSRETDLGAEPTETLLESRVSIKCAY